MSKGKLVRWAGLAVISSSAVLISCGPSLEEQVAGAVALTAVAATDTPTITATITATLTLTPTSTPTPTPSPLPFGRSVNPLMNPVNEHFYEAVTVSGGIDWFDARAAAKLRIFEGVRGHLATITSAQEDRFIVMNFRDAFTPPPSSWLGAFQPWRSAERDKDWQWVTGEPFVYTNWLPGEPNQFRGNEEDCMLPHSRADLTPKWNDARCDDNRALGYIVEYDPSPAMP